VRWRSRAEKGAITWNLTVAALLNEGGMVLLSDQLGFAAGLRNIKNVSS
jgi:hypothetical protein